jgi:hypothetical protein
MFIYAIGVERVRVGQVANLCVTRSGMMHLHELVRCVLSELSSVFWTA